MGYTSSREKIKNFIDQYILEAVKEKDLDYYEVVNGISEETNTTKGMIIEVLESYLISNKIKEIRCLTIPDSNIPSFIEKLRKREKIQQEMDKEMAKIEQLVPKKEVKSEKK